MNENQKKIYDDACAAIAELIAEERPGFYPIRLMVIGGSSSEMAGGTIGHASTYELGEALAKAVLDCAGKYGFAPAFQCCEHLNRALIVERETAEKYGMEQVWVCPRPKAGGSVATAAFRAMRDPVAVERVEADAGLDVGLTLIGMHLKRVAVPIRLNTKKIGEAAVTAARVRPKLIGGERARYTPED